MSDSSVFQYVIVGGGCAGTLLAAILQRLGFQTLVIERNRYPRFAIGESLTPLADQMLRDWAARYDLPHLADISRWGKWQRRFPGLVGGLKRGFSYVRHYEHRELDTSAEHADELLVAASLNDEVGDSHWLRADVDHWLAKQARACGAEVWEACELREFDRRDGQWQLTCTLDEGTQRRIRCTDLLIDATGAAGTVAGRCGSAEAPIDFRTSTRCIYTHASGLPRFENMLRDAGARLDDYPFRFDDAAAHHVIDDGWFWQIRFCDGRTSIGLVDNFTASVRAKTESTCGSDVMHRLAAYPALREWLGDLHIADPPGSWIHSGPLQRRRTTACGEGWLALPHTYAFIDPLHSTGIAWTLWGIDRIARAIEGRRNFDAWMTEYAAALDREVLQLDALIGLAYLAMPEWELFRAATLVYFAAATRQERAGSGAANTGFLGADDLAFATTVQQLVDEVAAGRITDAHTKDALRQRMREQLRPFDRIGLFETEIPHMYAHTAAPV